MAARIDVDAPAATLTRVPLRAARSLAASNQLFGAVPNFSGCLNLLWVCVPL
jgi:hypothetical protein